MNENNKGGIHWSFWLIGALTLLWNVGGSANYVMQMNPEMIDSYRASEQAIIASRPAWATAGFALGVFGVALGCVLLLLRKSASFYLFVVSLLGVIAAVAHTFTVDFEFSTAEILTFTLMPVVVAAFLEARSHLRTAAQHDLPVDHDVDLVGAHVAQDPVVVRDHQHADLVPARRHADGGQRVGLQVQEHPPREAK